MSTQGGVLAALLRPLVSASADAGANGLIARQSQIVDATLPFLDRGVDALAAELEAAVPTSTLEERVTARQVRDTIANVAAEVIAQIPAGENALINALESGLARISAAAAGP